ncbi:MAG: hypothetical protein JWM27_2466, partial [Gemmatimonadetes bacterium]|nr:hypothetical protein [Gemmatimonadota bacterium]
MSVLRRAASTVLPVVVVGGVLATASCRSLAAQAMGAGAEADAARISSADAVPSRAAVDSTRRRALPASPLLPPEHWAVAAAARAEGMGLVRLYLPSQRAVPRLLVARALR